MIKEYINELLDDNNEKLNKLEQQLKSLMTDLESATEWLDTLNAEKNVDKNIFSPRSIDPDLKSKTEDAQNNINKIKQDIEYVRSFIETHLRKKEEYEKLLTEIDEMSQVEENNITQTNNKDESEKILKEFLSDLYRKTELCLALLYSDQKRCKNELKNMKLMIRNMAEKQS